MQAIESILKAIEYIMYGYFIMASLYIFVFAFAGHFYKKQRSHFSTVQSKMAV